MPIPPFDVPETLTKEQVEELAKKFRPFTKCKEDGKYYPMKHVDLYGVSFNWDAKPDKKAGELKELYVLNRIWTVHSYGYQGFFKPSIAEVLQQIPTQYHLLKEMYFETKGPEDCHDLNNWLEHTNAGVHVASTTLYLPEPTLEALSRLWREHPEALSNEGRDFVRPLASAIRWCEQLEKEDREKLKEWLTANPERKKDD